VRTLFLVCRELISLLPVSSMAERGTKSSRLSSSPYKGTNSTMRVPPSRPHLNLIPSQRPYLPMPSCWGLRLQVVQSIITTQGGGGPTERVVVELVDVLLEEEIR